MNRLAICEWPGSLSVGDLLCKFKWLRKDSKQSLIGGFFPSVIIMNM